MDRVIQELKMLLLANTDITRYGDGYEKAMIQAIDVCEKNNIKSSEPQLKQADVSGSVCDCTHTQACETCAESKEIDWSLIAPKKAN